MPYTGFPWSECHVRKLATSHCIQYSFCLRQINRDDNRELSGESSFGSTRLFGRARNTRVSVQSPLVVLKVKCEKEATFFMASQVMRITLKAYDHELVDSSAKKIIETVKKNGSQVSGPVPLPTKKEVVTILRATHKYKDSREQFEQRTHKRLIDIITPTQKTVDALSRLEMPAGVYIDIKMKEK